MIISYKLILFFLILSAFLRGQCQENLEDTSDDLAFEVPTDQQYRDPPSFAQILEKYDSSESQVYSVEDYGKILIEFLLGFPEYYKNSPEDMKTYKQYEKVIEKYVKSLGKKFVTYDEILQELKEGRVSDYFTNNLPYYKDLEL